jgi:hypothetical protein
MTIQASYTNCTELLAHYRTGHGYSAYRQEEMVHFTASGYFCVRHSIGNSEKTHNLLNIIQTPV